MLKAIVVAVVLYLIGDIAWTRILAPVGLDYAHAFLAMLGGMLAGGYIARRDFVWVAVAINAFLSTLTYVLVANMRDQSPLDLLLEQHPMISVGSFVGAVLGASLGQWIALKKGDQSAG